MDSEMAEKYLKLQKEYPEDTVFCLKDLVEFY